MYTLDTGLVFDPLDLAVEVTPEAVRKAVAQKRFSVALAMSLRLCDRELVARVVEAVPSSDGGYYFPASDVILLLFTQEYLKLDSSYV